MANRAGAIMDPARVLGRALDLLAATNLESQEELLDMVKRARHEDDISNLKKRARLTSNARAPLSSSQPLQKPAPPQQAAAVLAQGGGRESQAPPSGAGGAASSAGTSAAGNLGPTQTRLMSMMRTTTGRGRKRKTAR